MSLLRITDSSSPVAQRVPPQISLLPELPMKKWPEGFVGVNKSRDNRHYEVLLGANAGTEAGKIWKFYPANPTVLQSLQSLKDQIIKLPPFVGNDDAIEALSDLVQCADSWIIEDSFARHTQRREYADTVEGAAISAYCKNVSKMRFIFHYLSMVVHSVRTPLKKSGIDVPINPILTDLPFSGKEFDETQSFDQKVEFLEQIDAAIVQYLRDILGALNQQ